MACCRRRTRLRLMIDLQLGERVKRGERRRGRRRGAGNLLQRRCNQMREDRRTKIE